MSIPVCSSAPGVTEFDGFSVMFSLKNAFTSCKKHTHAHKPF